MLLLTQPPDAIVADPRVLNSEQRDAALGVHALLRAIALEHYAPATEARGLRRFLPSIDETRYNHNLLIDGDRGSGKTALLVTLLDVWNQLVEGESSPGELDNDRKAKREAWGIDAETWPVVPVGLIDLEPLSKHTPVILHIAEQLERVVEAMEDGVEQREDPPPWHLNAEKALKARTQWQSLLQCILARWDFAAEQRWGRLDAESAQHELERGVREHQDLGTRFTHFVDALVTDYKKWRGWRKKHPPLFVLAIDDADMSIERTPEVLNALRVLHHPRLAFIVTGHTPLFIEAAETQFRERQKLADMAPRLARDIHDKVFPLSQRYELPAIAEPERVRYLAPIATLPVPARAGHTPTLTLGDLFMSPLIAPALPDRLRPLLDLNELARTSTSESSESFTTRLALHLWQRAQPPEALRSAVSADASRQHIVFNPPDRRSGIRITASGEVLLLVPQGESTRSTVVLYHRHSVVPRSEEGPAPALAAASFFANAIAYEHGGRNQTTGTSNRSGYGLGIASVRYELLALVAVQFTWPLPRGRRIYELSNFFIRWDRYVASLSSEATIATDAIDRVARWFVTLTLQLSPRDEVPLVAPKGPTQEAPSWETIVRRLKPLLATHEGDDDEADAWRAWARDRVLLLAAPESGLPVASARALLVAYRQAAGDEAWAQHCAGARSERLERAHLALGGTGAAEGNARAQVLLADIDGRTEGHPWHTHTRAVETPPVVDDQTLFEQAMQRMGFGRRADGATRRAPTLDVEALRVVRALLPTLDRTPRIPEIPFVAAGVWSEATKALGFPELATTITCDVEGRLAIERLEGRFTTMTRAVQFDTLIAHEEGPYTLMSGQRPLPPLLQYLYELFWDRSELPSDRPTWRSALHGSAARWTKRLAGVRRIDATVVELPWITTPWTLFELIDVERTLWTRLILDHEDQPGGAYVPTTFRVEQVVLDYFHSFCWYLARPGQLPRRSEFDDLKSSLRQMLQEAFKVNLEQPQPSRRAAIRELYQWWGHGTALLLAPESCAPTRFRTALRLLLVETLGKHSATKLREPLADLSALHQLRRDRLAVAFAEAPTPITRGINEVIAELDAGPDAEDWRAYLTFLAGAHTP